MAERPAHRRGQLGGILIESRSEIGGACRVVIGLGLNVSMSDAQAADLGQPWIAVHAAQAAAGAPCVSRNALAAKLLAALVEALAAFEATGFASFLADWNRLDIAAGRPVRIVGAGQSDFDGIACGIDDDGALIVETPDGRRQHLHAGEVSVRLGPA